MKLEMEPYTDQFVIPRAPAFSGYRTEESAPLTMLLGYNGLYILNEDAYEGWTVCAYGLPDT